MISLVTAGQDNFILGTLLHEAHNWFNVDQVRTGQWGGECKVLQETSQEQKYLVLSQLLTEAISLTNQKWDTSLILSEQSSLLVNKSVWVELLRFVPVLRVIHNPGDIGID